MVRGWAVSLLRCLAATLVAEALDAPVVTVPIPASMAEKQSVGQPLSAVMATYRLPKSPANGA